MYKFIQELVFYRDFSRTILTSLVSESEDASISDALSKDLGKTYVILLINIIILLLVY